MPADPLAHLKQFRATHPFKHVLVEGVRWDYIACGGGEKTLLLLPGLPGRGDTSFEYIQAFEQEYRVLSPSYPAEVRTVGQLVDGLAALLRAEGSAPAYVLGGSYSGLVAQLLVRRYPGRVSRLILSDTGVPRPGRALVYSVCLLVLRLLPRWAVHALWRLGSYAYLRGIDSQRAMWRAYFAELTAGITKEDCTSRLEVWVDFDKSCRFSPGDLDSWPGEVLVIEAEDDKVFRPRERAALRALYPRARVHVIEGSGHASSLARRDEYVAVLREFLGSQALERAAS